MDDNVEEIFIPKCKKPKIIHEAILDDEERESLRGIAEGIVRSQYVNVGGIFFGNHVCSWLAMSKKWKIKSLLVLCKK